MQEEGDDQPSAAGILEAKRTPFAAGPISGLMDGIKEELFQIKRNLRGLEPAIVLTGRGTAEAVPFHLMARELRRSLFYFFYFGAGAVCATFSLRGTESRVR